jgi:hypothetical protein
VGRSCGELIDEILDAVLRAHRAGNGKNNGSEYDQMGSHTFAKIAQHK